MTDTFTLFTRDNRSYESNSYLVNGEKSGVDAKVVEWGTLNYHISEGGIDIFELDKRLSFPKYAAFRCTDGSDYHIPQRMYVLEQIEALGGRVLNSRCYKRWPRMDKITQHFHLSKHSMPYVDTWVYGRRELILNGQKSYPFIAKKSISARGRAVYKVKSQKEMMELFDLGYWARDLLVQPFLTAGEDLRIIVIDGKAVGAMKRIASSGNFLTNYSAGGSIEMYDLAKDNEAKKIAEKAAEIFDLEYVGVDLMRDMNGKHRILELNRECQFKGFESVTQENIAGKVIGLLMK